VWWAAARLQLSSKLPRRWYGGVMAPVEVTEQDLPNTVVVDDEDELLIEEISIDGMCGVY
jgi:mycofactocin precursor